VAGAVAVGAEVAEAGVVAAGVEAEVDLGAVAAGEAGEAAAGIRRS
jgi:hypothetical protein